MLELKDAPVRVHAAALLNCEGAQTYYADCLYSDSGHVWKLYNIIGRSFGRQVLVSWSVCFPPAALPQRFYFSMDRCSLRHVGLRAHILQRTNNLSSRRLPT